VGSYPTFSPLPPNKLEGGLFSVALSLRFPSAAVSYLHCPVEPGRSSPGFPAATDSNT